MMLSGLGNTLLNMPSMRYDVQRLDSDGARSDVVEHGKCDETHNHHLEELQVVIAYEAQWFTQIGQVDVLPKC